MNIVMCKIIVHPVGLGGIVIDNERETAGNFLILFDQTKERSKRTALGRLLFVKGGYG
jgi:hypothetical protein